MPKDEASKPPVRSASVLVAVYILFAVAATGRSLYQLIAKFDQAPVAYSLSALAAIFYIVATFALVTKKLGLASYLLWFELAGVLIVGTLSLLIPEVFKAQSVWSEFGAGYGCVPLFLPIWGLIWLRRGLKVA